MAKRKRSYKKRSYKKRKPRASKVVYVEDVDVLKTPNALKNNQPEILPPGTVIVDEVKE